MRSLQPNFPYAGLSQRARNLCSLKCACDTVLLLTCRQEIICAGELADKMYLIASGEVEILQEVSAGVAGGDALISGVEMDFGDCQDGDMFDSCVPDLSSSPTGGCGALVGMGMRQGPLRASEKCEHVCNFATHLPGTVWDAIQEGS